MDREGMASDRHSLRREGRPASSRAWIRAALLTLIVLTAAELSANPFTSKRGAEGEQAPAVRVSSSSPSLISAQARLHERLGNLMKSWGDSPAPVIAWSAALAAFLYGFLHALGPGHRKTVVFSLYLAKSAPPWEPAATGLFLALLHGGASIVILLALEGVSGAVSARADGIALWMEGGAYLLLVLLAAILAIGALRSLVTGRHRHGEGKAGLAGVILTGAYPCPGAILVMVLASSLGSIGIGILAVLAMSIGMSIPIVAAGYLAWFGRSGLFLALKKRESLVARISAGVGLAGYLVLLAFSLYIALPFIAGLFRLAAF